MERSRTGVEEYTIGFVKRLLEQDSENYYVLFFNSFKKIEGDLSWLEGKKNVEIRNYGFPNKLLNFSMWFFGWPRIDVMLGGIDTFFAPNISFIALSKSCRFVLTVHDLSFERFPQHFSPKRRLWHFLLNPRKLCKRADKILAVSESTKFDLLSIYGIDKDKVEVMAPLIDYEFFLSKKLTKSEKLKIKKKYKLPEKFILFLGTIEPRKNIISVLRAFESLRCRKRTDKNLKLVIAGSLGWSYKNILEAIEKSDFRKDIVLTGFVDDQDKPAIYGLAETFVYVSFFEGYGFPPAEAMASGVPVVTSSCSSMPEVVGDAAILVDPYRPFDVVLALEILFSEKDVYNGYIRKGIARAKTLQKETQKVDVLEKLSK